MPTLRADSGIWKQPALLGAACCAAARIQCLCQHQQPGKSYTPTINRRRLSWNFADGRPSQTFPLGQPRRTTTHQAAPRTGPCTEYILSSFARLVMERRADDANCDGPHLYFPTALRGKARAAVLWPRLDASGSGLGAQREEVPGHQWGDAIGQGPIDQSLFCCVEN